MSYSLPLPNQLSIRSNYSQSSRTRLVEFGDGYIQRTPLGTNSKIRTIEVVHENLSPTDADTVLFVYDSAQSSGDSISITANELISWEGKFYITDVDVQLDDNERRTIVAQMREVFDL